MNLLLGIEERLKARLAERDALDREIRSLEEAKRLLAPYSEEQDTSYVETLVGPTDIGITDAVRGAYRLHADRRLSPTQIRDIVASSGFDLSKERYNNAMATIHQIIKRLVDSGEIEGPFPQDGEKAFRWGKRKTATQLAVRNKPASDIGLANDREAWLPKKQGISMLGMCDRSFDRFVKEGKIERRRGVAEGRFVYRRNDIERIALMRKEVVSSRQK